MMLYCQYSAKKLVKSGLPYKCNASFSICIFYRPSERIYNKASWDQATCIQVLSVSILRLTREITFYNNSLEDFLTFHNMAWNI